ncbi:MAG: 23S rRNA (adenine(2503)-C(2))-methyltransferase RlmN [Eubacteriales bacterium]|nr:23S rRNA (adenine(2503)-C(2))-methyltransferase RlmN [Eubacteriales bacterium]
MENKIDIMSLCEEEIAELMQKIGEPKYRAHQIYTFLSRGVCFDDMTNLSKKLRDKLSDMCEFRLPTVEKKLVSKIDGTVKYLMRLIDGEHIESVFMRYEHGNTLCVSSQVGCRMGCRFCASTIGGKVRDLTAGEILGQIITAQNDTGERVSNVVMMGIGEPLDNFDNVVKFLRLVNSKNGLNIGYRHISLSTCGLADRINMLAELEFPITLSISLHASSNEKRSEIMPVNNKWSIEKLLDACVAYYTKTGRRISFEYTLISGKNDTLQDARELAVLLRNAFAECEAPVHVNLIRVNEVEETGFHRGSEDSVNRFADMLNHMGVTATVRRRLGADVNAACGQLRHTNS